MLRHRTYVFLRPEALSCGSHDTSHAQQREQKKGTYCKSARDSHSHSNSLPHSNTTLEPSKGLLRSRHRMLVANPASSTRSGSATSKPPAYYRVLPVTEQLAKRHHRKNKQHRGINHSLNKVQRKRARDEGLNFVREYSSCNNLQITHFRTYLRFLVRWGYVPWPSRTISTATQPR